MTQLIILGHGYFASGLKSAVEQVVGVYPNCTFLDFPPEKTPDQLTKEIRDVLESKPVEDSVLFFCDILGGTPFRVASLIGRDFPNSEVITGTNLQMLLEVIMALSELAFEQLVSLSFESGKKGITSLSYQLQAPKSDFLSDDGI